MTHMSSWEPTGRACKPASLICRLLCDSVPSWEDIALPHRCRCRLRFFLNLPTNVYSSQSFVWLAIITEVMGDGTGGSWVLKCAVLVTRQDSYPWCRSLLNFAFLPPCHRFPQTLFLRRPSPQPGAIATDSLINRTLLCLEKGDTDGKFMQPHWDYKDLIRAPF